MPDSSYQHDATEHSVWQRGTQLAFMNWLQHTTDKNPVLFTVLSEVQHSTWHMAGA